MYFCYQLEQCAVPGMHTQAHFKAGTKQTHVIDHRTAGQQTVYFPERPDHREDQDRSLSRALATSAGQRELPKYRVLTKSPGRAEDVEREKER